MKDQYTADRRDPVVKRLEREGITALVAMKRVVGGVLLAMLLAQVPAAAFTKRDILDGLRRWEHGSYCQGLFNRGWIGEMIAFFSGC